MDNNVKNQIEQIHKNSFEEAKQLLPENSITELIQLVIAYASEETSAESAVQTLSKDYGPAAKKYLESISRVAVSQLFENTDRVEIQNLAKMGFPDKLYKVTGIIGDTVLKYMQGEINANTFVWIVFNSGIKDVSKDILKACDIDLDELQKNSDDILNLSSPVVGYMAITKAYEILMKSLDDASIAYEERIRIEEECNKSIALMREYREDMERVVSDFFEDHHEVLNAGFDQMSRAILDNDSNGYIRGNVEIQKLLNFDVQFTTQEEFDELMDSDKALKL
ncbi:MAG: hypothetical protein IJJ44_06525 [Solobacterium sp.]|nr:hypothetical protein [Solobacterium sp.]